MNSKTDGTYSAFKTSIHRQYLWEAYCTLVHHVPGHQVANALLIDLENEQYGWRHSTENTTSIKPYGVRGKVIDRYRAFKLLHGTAGHHA